jgi:hypothetical protein
LGTAKKTLLLEMLEDRTLLSNGLWYAVFEGMVAGVTAEEQTQYGKNLLQSAGVTDEEVSVVDALDFSGSFVVKTAPELTKEALTSELQVVPGFIFVEDYEEADPATLRKITPARTRSEEFYGPFDYDTFLTREKNGEFPDQGGLVDSEPAEVLTNTNAGSTGTSNFTQSETTVVAFGNTVVVGFNDSGSNAGGTNKFTGFARSTDGGATFTDGGTLPTNAGGDAGDPVLARNDTTGRLYLSTLGFSVSTIQMFRSDDGGATWMAPVNATPGGSSEDKQWHTVDNFAGAGGGGGGDMLIGGGNRGILVGGVDEDRLIGNGGDDILIGGSTTHDSNYAALDAIMAEWSSGNSYALRVAHIRGTTPGGANGSLFFDSSTVLDDGAVDRLTGSAGVDWFLANLLEDEITDLRSSETTN